MLALNPAGGGGLAVLSSYGWWSFSHPQVKNAPLILSACAWEAASTAVRWFQRKNLLKFQLCWKNNNALNRWISASLPSIRAHHPLLGNGQSLKHAKAIMRNRLAQCCAHLHREQTARDPATNTSVIHFCADAVR